jgi:hypothetical protein
MNSQEWFILASWIIIAVLYFVIYKQDRLIDKLKAMAEEERDEDGRE